MTLHLSVTLNFIRQPLLGRESKVWWCYTRSKVLVIMLQWT